jgi:cold shock CspA family protein
MSDKRHTGIVRKFVSERGFGFLSGNGGASDTFFHVSNCSEDFGAIEDVKEGQNVSYLIRPSPKTEGSVEAHDVRLV